SNACISTRTTTAVHKFECRISFPPVGSLFSNDRQRRCNLKVDDQQQLVFDLNKARGGNRTQSLLETLVVLSKKFRALTLIIHRVFYQLVRLCIGQTGVGASVFLDVIPSQVVQLVKLVVILAVNWPELR